MGKLVSVPRCSYPVGPRPFLLPRLRPGLVPPARRSPKCCVPDCAEWPRILPCPGLPAGPGERAGHPSRTSPVDCRRAWHGYRGRGHDRALRHRRPVRRRGPQGCGRNSRGCLRPDAAVDSILNKPENENRQQRVLWSAWVEKHPVLVGCRSLLTQYITKGAGCTPTSLLAQRELDGLQRSRPYSLLRFTFKKQFSRSGYVS